VNLNIPGFDAAEKDIPFFFIQHFTREHTHTFDLVSQEHRLSALAIIILGLGMAVTGLLPSYSGLIISTLIMSFGFHYFDTTRDSLTLQYFDEEKSPWVFGKLGSLASITNIGVGILIFGIAPLLSFTINHIAAVVLPAIGGVLWMIDYRIPFVGGAVFSLVSLLAVQKIRTPKQNRQNIRVNGV
jgi:MFS family permease